MYCTCASRNQGFTAKPIGDNKFNYDFWVCSACLKPTKLVWESITMKHVLEGAVAVLSQDGGAEGRTIITWAMADGSKVQTMVFKPYPRKVDMDQGRNICVELWQKMDKLIDEIRMPQTSVHDEYNKAQANMLADVIALVMSPFYEDSTAVLRESMSRWEARQEGRTRVSPGLAEAIWSPNTRFDGTPFSEASEARVRNGTRPKPTVVFDDQKITFIKHCLENGTQSAEVLAGMFECSVDDIKAAVG